MAVKVEEVGFNPRSHRGDTNAIMRVSRIPSSKVVGLAGGFFQNHVHWKLPRRVLVRDRISG